MSEPGTPEPVPETSATASPAGGPGSVPVLSRPDTGAAAPPEYEFTPEQNQVIDSLTNGILWVRIPLILTGLFQSIIAIGLSFRLHLDGSHIIGVLGHALAAVFCFLLAGWLRQAAAAFTRVTTTTGRDITNLLLGIRNLAFWFEMLAFFVKVYLILLGILLFVLFLGLLSGSFKGPGSPQPM